MFKPGDKVLWTDPIDDVECDCSKEFVLTKVYDYGHFLHVLGIGAYEDGTEMEVDLQCHENELSLVTKDKFPSFDGTNQSWCSEAGWVKHKEEHKVATTFEKELADIMSRVEEAISKILLSEGRIVKHKPYTWLDEPQDEHLRKASRHITTYQLIRDGQSPEDGEDHLHNAICRLSMAVAQRKINK